ncbi:protein kinase domain-containing protein [Pedobacter frigiditerrae]|uniref:protein kinase domain-containing protein n=1 Tax=Pedobacter frigiditerrae TaxID=2530452 RepID=UPI00292CF0F3|nr:protein kinase [Pedobacter frigiditerrae]
MCKGKIKEILKTKWADVEYFNEGGNSYVLKATDNTKPIAIKVFRRFSSPERYPRFIAEINTMAALRDIEGIVEVIDFNQQPPKKIKQCNEINELADLAYYVMNLYQANLSEKITSFADDDGTNAVKVMLGISKAIKRLHDKHYAHRDLKPENILIDDNENIFISDFGLSIDLNDIPEKDQRLSGMLELIGSVSYRAPELLRGRLDDSDHRPSDIFALGRILWTLIYGKEPHLLTDLEFTKMTIVNSGRKVRNPYSLDYVIADATKFDPNLRSTIDAFITGLEFWLKTKQKLTHENFIEVMLNDIDNQSKGNKIKMERLIREEYDQILAAFHRVSEELTEEWGTISTKHYESFGFGNAVDRAQADHFLDFCTPEMLGISHPLTVNCDGFFIRLNLENINKYPQLILAIYFELNLSGFDKQKYCIIPAYIPVGSLTPILHGDVVIKEFNFNQPNLKQDVLMDFEKGFKALDDILKSVK